MSSLSVQSKQEKLQVRGDFFLLTSNRGNLLSEVNSKIVIYMKPDEFRKKFGLDKFELTSEKVGFAVGSTMGFTGIGGLVGLLGGPVAPITVPICMGIGALVGLGLSYRAVTETQQCYDNLYKKWCSSQSEQIVSLFNKVLNKVAQDKVDETAKRNGNDQSKSNIWECKITFNPITDPVSTPHLPKEAYNRDDLLESVRRYGRCPLTNEPMTEHDFIERIDMRLELDRSILEYISSMQLTDDQYLAFQSLRENIESSHAKMDEDYQQQIKELRDKKKITYKQWVELKMTVAKMFSGEIVVDNSEFIMPVKSRTLKTEEQYKQLRDKSLTVEELHGKQKSEDKQKCSSVSTMNSSLSMVSSSSSSSSSSNAFTMPVRQYAQIYGSNKQKDEMKEEVKK